MKDQKKEVDVVMIGITNRVETPPDPSIIMIMTVIVINHERNTAWVLV